MKKKKYSPSGRFVKSEPNIQNIPIRTPEGAAIRKAFIDKLDKMERCDD